MSNLKTELSKGMLLVDVDLLDEITTRDGRISKKLFEKVVRPLIAELQNENERLKEKIKDYDTQLNIATRHFMDKKDTNKRVLHESLLLWKIALRDDTDLGEVAK